ncbi:hypothetical protein [Thermus caldilimi]|uniref:hypothetical protein n=1 Tax=Thermus caldilimi TaxID=2483360 RepID=UPI0010762097|nr:hypothetical protein [Thermus caldilimi]
MWEAEVLAKRLWEEEVFPVKLRVTVNGEELFPGGRLVADEVSLTELMVQIAKRFPSFRTLEVRRVLTTTAGVYEIPVFLLEEVSCL